MVYVPQIGEVVWLNFNPQAGHEQTDRRPALILTPITYNNKVGLVICCPITSRIKGYPFEVRIPSGFDVTGVVLSDQVKSLDWRVRQAELFCKLPDETVRQVLRKLGTLLSEFK